VHYNRLDIEEMCNAYYIIETFMRTYTEVVHLLSEEDLDRQELDVIVLPSDLKKYISIPKKKKHRNQVKIDLLI
jgi:hypothetical protein